MGEPESKPTDVRPGPVRVNGEDARKALLAEVFRSRSRAAQLEREPPGGATQLTLLRARSATLDALENYSAALRLRGWPTPSSMAREIHLLRSLCGRPRPER
jgi:hypothetical protein